MRKIKCDDDNVLWGGKGMVETDVGIADVSWGPNCALAHMHRMSTLGLCGAGRWHQSQPIKSNMFTEGENVRMEG